MIIGPAMLIICFDIFPFEKSFCFSIFITIFNITRNNNFTIKKTNFENNSVTIYKKGEIIWQSLNLIIYQNVSYVL